MRVAVSNLMIAMLCLSCTSVKVGVEYDRGAKGVPTIPQLIDIPDNTPGQPSSTTSLSLG